MIKGVVVRVLLMVISGNWVWDQQPPVQRDAHEYIVDVPTRYVDGPAASFYPVVMMHGMNDAGHNGHMERMRNVVSDTLDGAYVTSVQLGKNIEEDEWNSVHLTMDVQVDMFASVVAKDPNLRKGFHAIGFSQGGLIVRGYIERYNDPPVVGFLACHSPLAGIGSLPICNPRDFICRQINKLVGEFAYSSELQDRIAQANFYRDPTRIKEYLKHARFLPDINNERETKNETYKSNFASIKQLIMVRALRDTQIAPTLSSWFGAYQDGDWSTLLKMNETEWYKTDSFGLKTLDKLGRITIYETPDNHLQFSDATLSKWIYMTSTMVILFFLVLVGVSAEQHEAVWTSDGLFFNEGIQVDLNWTEEQLAGRITSDLEVLPVAIMHGMGDAAHNPGMQRLRKAVETRLGTYATNVQVGKSQAEDTSNGFFMNMNHQVDYFAKVVQADVNLQHGFNAIGLSQGNLVIRGYIERYNNPPVRNFISIHGPLAGVGALPHCKPINIICKKISQLISTAAYSNYVQNNVAQANYFRDPSRIKEYEEHALFLPDINNEKESMNETYKSNFAKLDRLILVRAAKDTMVYPHESEWFGAYENGNWNVILPMNKTAWYKQDSFGLKTLHEQGKIEFLETDGDHLQFSTNNLLQWVDRYFH